MNKLYLAFIFQTAIAFGSFSQIIANPDFENWTTTNYSEANNWSSSNQESVRRNGSVTVYTVNGFIGKAARLQTIILGTDTTFGYITYGNDGDPVSGQGGLPYTQKPTNITGYYRYNLPVNDTALMLVKFKKAGVVLCSNTIKVRGTGSQTVFTSFTHTLSAPSLTVNPDSVVIAFASSNAIPNIGIQNGSYFELDELNFTGAGITQSITNGSFENWIPFMYNKLNAWNAAGSGVTKVAPGQNGNFAAEFNTVLAPGNQAGVGGMSNGYFQQGGGPPKGGVPYTAMLDTLYGYYKFSGASDSGVVVVNLRKNNAPLAGTIRYFKNQPSYKLFKVPISSGTAPDTIRIEFYSSMPPGTITAVGSKFTIDNLWLYTAPPVGLIDITSDSELILYPNPASELLLIRTDEKIKFTVKDMQGKEIEVESYSDNNGVMKLDLGKLKSGIYFISLQNSKGTKVYKVIRE